MPDQIYIGNGGFTQGLTLNKTAFNIGNDSFPYLYNFYTWRGRVKKKRGTTYLGQLEIQIQMVASGATNWQYTGFSLTAGAGNLLNNASFNLTTSSTPTIVPGSISITVGANTYTEPSPPNGTLIGAPGGTGTINYATGAITISGGGTSQVTGLFDYYPRLPVMGLRDFSSSVSSSIYPLTIAFDTQNAYQINQTGATPFFYNVSYYKNTGSPVLWNGGDYQQFWTTNYPQTNSSISGSLWATNNNPGFHFVNATYTSGSGTTNITFNFKSKTVNYTSLIVGDKVWFNEWTGGSTINGLTGTVSNIAGAASGNYILTFATNQTVSGTGMAQLLTASITGQDGIRWYDGDPTGGTGLPTGTGLGWVNFAPPLTAATVSINDTPPGLYYLVGALMIVAFKDRLLFFSPYIQTSLSGGVAIQLQDTVIWSWNGTPYYESIVPFNQIYDVTAYYVDQTGKGGWLSAGISQPIVTVGNNEDVLIVGFGGQGRKTRFVYTSNDLQPFLFFNINSELPSQSTFSTVALDRGNLDIGQYGLTMTDQQSCQRVDLQIPDSIFQIQALNNGYARVNAIRDFNKEWIYFAYPLNTSAWKFPTQTFLFNYRDNTWAIFYENFTAHGRFRAQKTVTWATLPYNNWGEWQEPWNSGANSPLNTQIIAGNPQGYVLIKEEDDTAESVSGDVLAIATMNGITLVTSQNHCVQAGDYLYMSNALGTIGPNWNGLIGQVTMTVSADQFVIDIPFPSGTYLGMGQYTRLCQPKLQTKQFPFYWEQGRQCVLQSQKYLLDTTDDSQITLQIYLSMDPINPWNDQLINPPPNGLVYTQILYTCPESTNLGLTPANVNLQMPLAASQAQIWHRINTAMVGDAIQIGITLNDLQMRNLIYATAEITLHGILLNLERGPLLA
jgi:hypothetical protein